MKKLQKPAVVVISFVVYLSLHLLTVDSLGVMTVVFAYIPITAVSFLYGQIAGVIAAIILIVFGILVNSILLGDKFGDNLLRDIIGSGFVIVVAYILGFIKKFKDNEKKCNQEAIALKSGIDLSDDVVFVTDIEGIITYANPAFTKVYGYTKEEWRGKTPRILKSGVQTDQFYKEFWKQLLEKKTINFDMTNKRKDGTLIEVYQTANPIVDDKEKVVGFFAIQRDLSNVIKIQKELSDKTKELEGMKEIMIDRELKMINLKKTIRDITLQLGEKKQ